MLQYGSDSEMPQEGECVDMGTVPANVAPRTVENRDLGENSMDLADLFGSEVPPVRRVLMTVAHYRNKGVEYPYAVKIPGLGRLLVGLDKYDCECWTVINS